MIAAARTSDRTTLRQVFIEREDRPTYEGLSEEFGVPLATIKNWAADESWQRLRVANQERLAEKSDALAVILRATKIDARIIDGFANDMLIAQAKIAECLSDVDARKAASTRAATLNTLTFALKNLSETARNCGIIGLPRGLAENGKEDNGRWNPQLLHQINVTVQNLSAKAKEAEVTQAVEKPVDVSNELQSGQKEANSGGKPQVT